MAEKKNPSRFTIQFNPNDPGQAEVTELLEQQGRRKAQFLTNAVLHYIRGPELPEMSGSQSLDKALLEELVLEILSRREVEEGNSACAIYGGDRREKVASEKQTDMEEIFGKNGLLAIASTLSAFQRG